MKRVDSIGGRELKEMFASATIWLEKSAPDIDALNVFPVPDGDTGTNMLLTMRSSLEEIHLIDDGSVSAVSEAVARGALMGARGNSGVILYQIWQGLALGLRKKESFTGSDLARALHRSSVLAYRGVSNPVEGTILTVIKDISAAAQAQVSNDANDIVSVMEAIVHSARESVANTPNLLSVLREAGVVDAGGQGLYTILDGALRQLKGEREKMKFHMPQIIVGNTPAAALPRMVDTEEKPYGYCTDFLLKGKGFDPEKIRTRLKGMGESLIVVGDESAVRVHIHTLDPDEVIRYGRSLGTMHRVSTRNMDEQHKAYLERQEERMPAGSADIVVVVPGDGLADVFKSLGAKAVVSGGQTMNPSTRDLLRAVELVPSDKVIILPNNKNIISTANQVQSVTKKKVIIVPAETIPQGVSALVAFSYDEDFEANARAMKKALMTVRSIEITQAVRPAKLGGLDIKPRQAVGFLDGDPVAVSNTPAETIIKVLAGLNLKKAEVVTLYYGADTEQAEAEEVGRNIHHEHSHLQVDVVLGGQLHYNYIASVE